MGPAGTFAGPVDTFRGPAGTAAGLTRTTAGPTSTSDGPAGTYFGSRLPGFREKGDWGAGPERGLLCLAPKYFLLKVACSIYSQAADFSRSIRSTGRTEKGTVSKRPPLFLPACKW